MSLFNRGKFSKSVKKKGIPEGLWTKCPSCGHIVFNKALESNLKVCPKCDYHFTLGAYERIAVSLDPGTFEEISSDLGSLDPLEFTGTKTYKQKLAQDMKKTGLKSACITGYGDINSKRVLFGVTDSRFIMGSMGSVVGEKITRLFERGLEERLPVIIVSGSGGGARMYEGMLSLMQMAKTSGACAKFKESGGFFLSVLTNPTMAGVMASYASLGDLVIAEPKALIGFTGPRVIEQTIRQTLPEGFQKSEFLLEHGLLDMIVNRKDFRERVTQLLDYCKVKDTI